MTDVQNHTDAEKDAAFPWALIFQAAMMHGLAPDDVWQMTAGELHALFSALPDHRQDGRLLRTLVRPSGGRRPAHEHRAA